MIYFKPTLPPNIVIQKSMDGKTLKVWDNAKEASEGTGIHITGIQKSCRGEQPGTRGYKWEYKEDYEHRGKRSDYSRPDMYKFFKKKSCIAKNISKGEAGRIWDMLNLMLMEKIIWDSKEMRFPFGIGNIRVIKTKPNAFTLLHKLPLDRKASEKAGKDIYEMNEHRDGHLYGFFWDKNKKYIKPLILGIHNYKFNPVANARKRLEYVLKNVFEIDYLLVKPSGRKIKREKQLNLKTT